MKIYCENCKWLDTVPVELGFGVHCRLYIPKESPLSKKDIGRSLDISEDNKNNDCKYYKPHFIKRIKDFFNAQERGSR